MIRTYPSEGELFTIAELSRASGVSTASIKFYVREGLLQPPDPSRPRRAYYDGRHVRRLATIRALRDVGGLSIDTIRRALSAVERPGTDAVDVIAPAIDALAPPARAADATLKEARADVAKAFEGLNVRKAAGSRETIAVTVASLRRLGSPIGVPELTRYLELLRPLAKEEIESTSAVLRSDKETSLEIAILGTALFEPILIGIRRALHEHYTTELVRVTSRQGSPYKRSRTRRTPP